MEKVSFKTKPVAWCGESVTKYQSSASFVVSNNRTITLYGDPKSTEDAAYESLKNEISTWKKAVDEIIYHMR